MQPFSDIPEDEWIECSTTFDRALSKLSIGQLVQDPRYSMMDLMSAIEINDPRTDSYAAAKGVRDGQLPDFDASHVLSAQEVVWTLDEIMRLEATFQDGQPLMSTVWNCNYFRPSSLAALASTCDGERSASIQAVFRAMLLGVLKTQEIVWEECCKGQVYEHEDVHLASSTLSFDQLMAACYPFPHDSSPSSPLPAPNPLVIPDQEPQTSEVAAKDRTVSIDDVLRLLDECSTWIQSEARVETEQEEDALNELAHRVRLRIDLLYIQALLTFPAQASPSQVQHHLTRITTYLPALPSARSEPLAFELSPLARSAFHPSRSVPLLATSAPPRLIDPFPVGQSYDKNVRDLVTELDGLCQLWNGWRTERFGWKDVKEYSRTLSKRALNPYLRSLHQTVLTSTPSHIFSVSPVIHFATSFLATCTSIPSPFFLEEVYSVRRAENDYAAPGHVVFAWLERLANQLLRTSLPLACQNRTRQFRWIRKSIPVWSDLIRETERDIAPLLLSISSEGGGGGGGGRDDQRAVGISNIGRAIRSTFAELVMESLASGFEPAMELYQDDEWARVWFFLGSIGSELSRNWECLLDGLPGDDAYVRTKLAEARNMETMAKASHIMTHLFPSTMPKFSSPFLASRPMDPNRADRGKFQQRFDWIAVGRRGGIVSTEITYDGYLAELERLEKEDTAKLALQANLYYQRTMDCVDATPTLPSATQAKTSRPELDMKEASSLKRVAHANMEILARLLDSSPRAPSQTSRELKWAHPWFPVFAGDSP